MLVYIKKNQMCLGEIGGDVKGAAEAAASQTGLWKCTGGHRHLFIPSFILSLSPLNLLTQQRKNAADVNSEMSLAM